jgi:hypothetical protein
MRTEPAETAPPISIHLCDTLAARLVPLRAGGPLVSSRGPITFYPW